MVLARNARLGPYEILGPLGTGGMGEVYKARDTRLDRTVAIKILPAAVAADPHRRERFRREARAIATLSHPHICALHDIGDADGVEFLVMEYLPGETLAHRLLRGPLPIAEVVRIGADLAEALDAAHRQGVVHRDLKPSNVMLTAGGATILDFGLATWQRGEVDAMSPGLPAAPSTVTQTGMIVGTIQYMAPEQVEGKAADARADIFALGAMLYEMTTGRKAFEGASGASVMAAIVSSTPPPMAAAQPLAPPALERVVLRCLAKDPEQRWQSARDLAGDLRWIVDGDHASAASPIDRTPWRRERLAWSAALAAGAVALVAVLMPLRLPSAPPASPMRFEIAVPDGSFGVHVPIVSPDGRKIAFVAASADGKSFLWVRPLAALQAKPIVEADDHAFPFWSPDSRWLAFFADRKLKKIDADGGPVQVLCDAPAGRGGAWNRDGVILFAPAANTPLYRIDSGGAALEQVTTLTTTRSERSHRFPHFLSDGRHFTYAAVSEPPAIAVGSLGSAESTRVVEETWSEAWAPPGFLLFVRDGNLMRQPFDHTRLRFTGEAAPLTNRVAEGGVAQNEGYSVSDNGVLTYVAGNAPSTRLTWFSRTGERLSAFGPDAEYQSFSVAADGQRVVAERDHPQTGHSEVWVLDLSRGAELRLVPGQMEPNDPVWSPDGTLVAYDALPPGKQQEHLFIKPSNGTGSERLFPVKRDFGSVVLDHWSPDGRYLLFELFDHTTAIHDLWFTQVVAAEQQPRVFLRTPFNKVDAQFSPDGRWVAYASDDSGEFNVYVQSFPEPRNKWQISTNGGRLPRWRRDGKELFYLTAGDMLTAVPIDSGGEFRAGAPKPLFESPNARKRIKGRYDVHPSGDRFLFDAVAEGAKPPAITVVLDWTADVKR
jgi:serine/threonine protein kinase/Tol biopolymer transport system component